MPTTVPLAQPDIDPAMPTGQPAGHSDGAMTRILDGLTGIPNGVWLAAIGITALAATGALLYRRTSRTINTGNLRADRILTFLGAAVATGVVANGMWEFFGDVLGIKNPVGRGGLFAFFEIAMLASAFRSRRARLDRAAKQAKDSGYTDPSIDIDGIAVWVLALLSGGFAASDEPSSAGRALRFVAPLVATWLWERGLAGELRQFTRPDGDFGTLRRLWDRILVWLRLADPKKRNIGQVDRQRRIARFARTAYRLHLLKDANAKPWRISRARRSLRRQTEAANEHLELATDPTALAAVQAQIALLFGVEDGTTKTAVSGHNPLQPDIRTGHEPDAPADTMAGHPADMRPPTRPDTTPDTLPDTARTAAADTLSAALAVTVPDTRNTTVPDIETGSRPDTQTRQQAPADRTIRVPRRRTPSPTPKWSKEQVKAFKLRDTRPDMTYPLIAREVGVSEKTVSRWMKARDAAEQTDNAPDITPVERTPIPIAILPFAEPNPTVLSGVNGHDQTLEEN